MTAKGHIVLSSALTLGIATYLKSHYPTHIPSSVSEYIVTLTGLYLGALLPDVEEPESFIGNKLKLFSVVVASFIKHRTLTHYLITPLFIIAISVMFLAPYSLSQWFCVAAGVGILMHDVGDMITNGGIKGFFFPFLPNTRIALLPSFLRFDTFSFVEHIFILTVLIPLNIYFLFKLAAMGIFQ